MKIYFKVNTTIESEDITDALEKIGNYFLSYSSNLKLDTDETPENIFNTGSFIISAEDKSQNFVIDYTV